MDINQDVYAAVSKHYSSVSNNSTKHGEDYGKRVAQSFGYSEEELASVPADSNLGVSCGNPLAVASLREVWRLPGLDDTALANKFQRGRQ